jgi:hypothetical protein
MLHLDREVSLAAPLAFNPLLMRALEGFTAPTLALVEAAWPRPSEDEAPTASASRPLADCFGDGGGPAGRGEGGRGLEALLGIGAPSKWVKWGMRCATRARDAGREEMGQPFTARCRKLLHKDKTRTPSHDDMEQSLMSNS